MASLFCTIFCHPCLVTPSSASPEIILIYLDYYWSCQPLMSSIRPENNSHLFYFSPNICVIVKVPYPCINFLWWLGWLTIKILATMLLKRTSILSSKYIRETLHKKYKLLYCYIWWTIFGINTESNKKKKTLPSKPKYKAGDDVIQPTNPSSWRNSNIQTA